MTVRFNHANNQAQILQQLKAAQSRVETLQQQQVQQQKPDEQQNLQANAHQQQQQTYSSFNALNHAATMNLYDHKELSKEQRENALNTVKPTENNKKDSTLSTELAQEKSKVTTHERQLTEIQGQPKDTNPEIAELKNNPIYEKLPDDVKSRADVAQLINNVDSEALLDPDQAVNSLVDQALMGNKKAFMKLDEYSKNPYDKLQESSGKGIEKVIAGADGRPKILEMIAGTSTEKAGDAAAKLMNLSDRNPRAQQGTERLLRQGAINFTKTATEAVKQDPGHAAKSINTLMQRGNLSKSDRKSAVNVLGQIAKESPTGAAGQDAARGLTKAVKNEPLDIAKSAAIELKEATLSGNDNAMHGLKALSKCDDPSRAALALTQLGEVAMSGSSNATEGLTAVKSVAEDPTSNSKVRNQAVGILGNIANSGGANGKEAVQTISDIAVNKSNPSSGTAFNEIGKMNNATLGITTPTANKDIKENSNLSDTDTYKKVMATQQQINTLSSQPSSFLNKFAMQFMQAV